MCSIAGIINLKGRPVDHSLLRKMNNRLRHRGPDDEGYVLIQQGARSWAEYSGCDSPGQIRDAYTMMPGPQDRHLFNIGLAHRRFAIVDPTPEGHQPFFDSERICCVLFHGEIHNYVELRDALMKLGHTFRSASDTEVIVEAYKAWGVDCFLSFNGMWALALYDFRDKRLIVSRDRFGEAPLYWTRHRNSICFASEIKALLEMPGVGEAKSVNEETIYPYLVYSRRDLNDTTFFEGIYCFPAASWAVLDEHFPNTVRRYWKLPEKRLRERDVSVREAATCIRDTLQDSVRIRLRADVPWGMELSGGLDTSVLVALASQLSEKPVITYTVRYPEEELNEDSFARSVAHYHGTDHRVIEPSLDNLWHEIFPFTYLEEEPYHAPNIYIRQLIFRRMRAEGLKIVLSGEAGDELFAGYAGHFVPAQVENLLTGQLGTFINNGLHWSQGNRGIKSLMALLTSLLKSIIKQHLPNSWVDSVTSRRKLKHTNDYVDVPPPMVKGEYLRQTLSETLYNELTNTHIPYGVGSNGIPYWVRTNDRTRMGLPIEGRAPFLDYRMVELAFSLPVSYLIRDGWHKWILRKAFQDILPREVVWRKEKRGLRFPFERFFSTSFPSIQAILRPGCNPYVDLSSFRDLDAHRLRTNARGWAASIYIWRMISFLLWYELFVNGNQELFSRIHHEHPARIQDVEDKFVPEFLSSCAVASPYPIGL